MGQSKNEQKYSCVLNHVNNQNITHVSHFWGLGVHVIPSIQEEKSFSRYIQSSSQRSYMNEKPIFGSNVFINGPKCEKI